MPDDLDEKQLRAALDAPDVAVGKAYFEENPDNAVAYANYFLLRTLLLVDPMSNKKLLEIGD